MRGGARTGGQRGKGRREGQDRGEGGQKKGINEAVYNLLSTSGGTIKQKLKIA